MKLLLIIFAAVGLAVLLAGMAAVGALMGNYVVAGMFGLLFLAYVLFLLVLKRKVGKFLREIMETLTPLPDTITLAPIERVDWPDQEAGRSLFQEISRLGFQPVSAFGIAEMPGVELIGFANEPESVYAALCRHPQAGVWVDIAARYQDGGALTVTNSKEAGPLDKPEGWVTVKAVDASPSELWARFRANRRRGAALRPATAGNFKIDFENAYADEMAWRKARGGATEDEVRRVAANAGIMATEEQIQRTVEIERMKAGGGPEED